MTTGSDTRLLPLLAVIGAVALWGSSFAAMKFAVAHLPPASVVALRMLIASALILPLVLFLPRPAYRPGDWKLIVLMALFEPCLYFLFEANALVYTTSSQAGMIAALVPLLSLIGARLFLNEEIGRLVLAGILVSVVGVLLLTLAGRPQPGAPNPLLGNLLEFIAMCCAAGYVLSLKSLSQRYSPLHLTAAQFFIGTVFFLPALVIEPVSLAKLSGLPGLTVLFLGSVVTFGAFILYNFAISRMSAGQVTAFINLIPVIALLLGWSLMGELMSLPQWLAALLVMIGVGMSQVPPPRPPLPLEDAKDIRR